MCERVKGMYAEQDYLPLAFPFLFSFFCMCDLSESPRRCDTDRWEVRAGAMHAATRG
jgi:hypothetical protein